MMGTSDIDALLRLAIAIQGSAMQILQAQQQVNQLLQEAISGITPPEPPNTTPPVR